MKILDGKNKKSPLPVIMAKREIERGTDEFIINVDFECVAKNLELLGEYEGYYVDVKSAKDGFLVKMTVKR